VIAAAGSALPQSVPDGVMIGLSNGRALTAIGSRQAVTAALAELAVGAAAPKPAADEEDDPDGDQG